MLNHALARLDRDETLSYSLSRFCRLKPGEIWRDRQNGHRVGCLDAASREDAIRLCGKEPARLAIHDPPYNLIAFEQMRNEEFAAWLRQVVDNSYEILDSDSS